MLEVKLQDRGAKPGRNRKKFVNQNKKFLHVQNSNFTSGLSTSMAKTKSSEPLIAASIQFPSRFCGEALSKKAFNYSMAI